MRKQLLPGGPVFVSMRLSLLSRIFACCGVVVACASAQVGPEKKATTGAPEQAAAPADARTVELPVVVFDKKGPVTTLGQQDFAVSVEGKPQTIRYFSHGEDLPLTVGLLVDVSRNQTANLAEEQKAGQSFLEGLLKPAAGPKAADKAFVMQFGHTAELLQDVTASRELLASGLKEVGTETPGTADETESAESNSGSQTSPNSSPNQGGYGRRSGYPQGGRDPNAGSEQRTEARGGNVLYDSLFLASGEVMQKQKGRRVLVVLSGGVDRHSKESLKEAIEAAQRADTTVYAVYSKGQASRPMNRNVGGYPGGGYPGYGYPGYGRPGYPPTTGGSGSDGVYADPDGRKILQQICSATGGRTFEVKGKGSLESIFTQIGEEIHAQYRLGFDPTLEAHGAGFHPVTVTLTNPANKSLDLQTRDGFYGGETKPRD